MKQNTLGMFAAAVVIFVGGYLLGYVSADTASVVVNKAEEGMVKAVLEVNEVVQSAGDNGPAPVVENGDAVAFSINVESIPDSQRAFLQTMGITGNEIVVTNTMLACAEAEIGVERMIEIRDGATPSMSEGFKLAGCY